MSNQEHIDLREYLERIMAERDKAMLVASREMERRLEDLNRLREEVIKDRSIYMTKDVYQQMHNALMDRVFKLETFQSKTLGFGGALVLVAGLIGAVLTHLFK